MRLQRGMGSCIVTMEDDAPPVDQFWAFLKNSSFKSSYCSQFMSEFIVLLAERSS